MEGGALMANLRCLRAVGALLVACGAGPALSADPPTSQPSRDQMLGWLRALKPLPKVHYSFPIQDNLLFDGPLLYEYVRLTRAASLRMENCTQPQVDAAVAACTAVNGKDRTAGAKLGMNYSPWHRKFDKDAAPTVDGPTAEQELRQFRERLQAVGEMVERANRRHGSRVEIGAILLDCERFRVRPGDAAWNDAITRKLNQIYDLAQAAYPKARIEWYNRGAMSRPPRPGGWEPSPYSTAQERGVAYACSLYKVAQSWETREVFRRTVENARQHGVEEVTPWVALASGYRPTIEGDEWEFDWDYDVYYSWMIGMEINHPWFGKPEQVDRFAPWHAAKVVVFYPPPFFPKTPAWGRHFVAYVRGANRVMELP